MMCPCFPLICPTGDLSSLPPLFDQIIPWEEVYPVFGDQDAGISGFLSHISIVILEAEQVYLKLQVTNFKIKKAITNPKPPSLKTVDISKTVNP